MLIQVNRSPLTGLIVPLAEVKLYSKIDYENDDSLIQEMINSATLKVEDYCNLLTEKRQVEAIFKPMNDNEFQLPFANVRDIVSVKNQDNEDVEHEYYGGNLLLITSTPKILKVIYQSGFDAVPVDLKLAVKKIVETYYNNRSDLGKSITVIPISSIEILNAYRINGVY